MAGSPLEVAATVHDGDNHRHGLCIGQWINSAASPWARRHKYILTITNDQERQSINYVAMREESIDNSCFQAFLVAACETHLRPHSIKRPHNRPAAECLDWQHHAVSRHGIQTLDSELMLCGAASGDPQTVDWRSFLIGGLQPFEKLLQCWLRCLLLWGRGTGRQIHYMYHGISETIYFCCSVGRASIPMVLSLGLSNRADHTGNILWLAECGQCGVRVSSHISLPRHLKQISDTRSQYVFVSFSLSKNKSFCLPTVKYTAKQKPQRTRVVYPAQSFMD